VLALVGRVEARDWVDVVHVSEHVQPLGYLAWAACGKDAGFSPAAILEHTARSTHYAPAEIQALSFAPEPPDAAALARRWRAELAEARGIVALLPPAEVGRCVLARDGTLFTGSAADLRRALDRKGLVFHEGAIRGALPQLRRAD
jgi:hypothetical protein